MQNKIGRRSVSILCGMMLATLLGCAKPPRTVYICAIERPELGMIEEQIHEAERAVDPKLDPLLPYTYQWLKRLDRECGIFALPE